MRTNLTIKLQEIVNLASKYSKEIFNQYLREQDPKRATMLCTLWGALDTRVRWVQEVIYATEFWQKWWDVVTQKERKSIEYSLPSPIVQKSFDSVSHIVDRIMFLARRHIENNYIGSLSISLT